MLFKMEYGNGNYLQIHMPGRFRSTYAKLGADVAPLRLEIFQLNDGDQF